MASDLLIRSGHEDTVLISDLSVVYEELAQAWTTQRAGVLCGIWAEHCVGQNWDRQLLLCGVWVIMTRVETDSSLLLPFNSTLSSLQPTEAMPSFLRMRLESVNPPPMETDY